MTRVPDLDIARLRAAIEMAADATGDRIGALRRELEEIIESGSLTNTDDEHDPDGTTIAYERARTAALLTRALEDLEELGRARARLDAGDYGCCGSCGRSIGMERLLALPTTRRCVTCAQHAARPGPPDRRDR